MDPVNVVNRLSDALDALKTKLDETVSNYRDVLTYDPNNNRIGINPQLQNQVDRYRLALGELRMEMPSLEGMLMAGLGGNVFVWDADVGPPDLVLPPDQLKRTVDRMKNAKMFVTRQGGEVNVELAPDFEKTVQDASKLFNELGRASRDYWEAVQRVVDEFNKSSGGRFKLKINDDGKLDIDEDVHRQGFDKVVNLNREYDARLQELIRKYGAVVSEDGRKILVDPSKLDAFRADLSALNAWYGNELDKILKEHGLTVKDGKIVVDASIYSDVFSKLSEIGQEHSKRFQDIRSRFGHMLVATTDEKGRTVYMLKPSAISDVALYNTFVNIVDAHGAAVQQTIQNIANKYGDVLSYDPATGRVAPSKKLEDMLSRYDRAMQEVNQIIGAMSAVAGMLQTTVQQLPIDTVRFQTYDKATNQWVEVSGETPIYVRNEKMREEIVKWMEQNKGKVKVVAFYDTDKPVAYVFNDRDEGYIINPVTGEARRAKGVSAMVDATANAMWYKSLTDDERKKLERWLEAQRRKTEIEQLPAGLRELYAALTGAGQFAVILPAVDVLSRWLRREDPTKGFEELEVRAAAAAEASPLAFHIGQAVGLIGVGGLAAEALIARGAAAGAQGVGRQFLAGFKASAKPAVIGAAAGTTFGAVEGALTGRDPLAEAVKFGTVGLMAGLGGVTREQLIAGGVLGGVVGVTTAKEHGVEKGLEAGSAVFLLPVVAPEKLARGVFTGLTAERRPAAVAGLRTEPMPAVEMRYAQTMRELAAQVRSAMEKKPLPGLTPEEAAAIAVRLRARPAEQREFFAQLVEDALSKIRMGDDVALVQLRLLRDKLNPVSKMRFDEVLRRYGLTEVKHRVPEYALREEGAQALARLFRREPEYRLTDESARLLDQLFKMRQEPQYALTDEAAQRLNLFLRRRPEYELRDEVAPLLDRLFKRDMQRRPEYALTDEAAKLLDQLFKTEVPLTGRAAAEEVRLKPRRVLTDRKAETELQPKPTLTAKTEVQLPARQSAETGGLLGTRTALEYALRTKAETAPEYALRLTEISKLLKTPHRVQPLLRRELLRKERRPIIPLKPPVLQTEMPPQYDKPLVLTPELFGDIPRYSSPLLTTTTTPTTANVPSPSTYPPVTVPRISEVPTVGVPPAPINEKSPTPRQTRLPFGWWRFLPPWKVADDRAGGGAYKVQEGKRQILALA
jgi:hypothetical protein